MNLKKISENKYKLYSPTKKIQKKREIKKEIKEDYCNLRNKNSLNKLKEETIIQNNRNKEKKKISENEKKLNNCTICLSKKLFILKKKM